MFNSSFDTTYYGEFKNNDAEGEGVILNAKKEIIAAGIFVNGKLKY